MTLEYTVRGYAGGAPATTLSSGITNSATSITIASGTGYPTTNFALVIDPGTASEEKIFVGSRSAGTLSSCTRGIDSTSGVSHLAGAVVRHVLIAQDLSESNAVAAAMTTKGDLLTRNSTATAAPQRLAVGTDGQRLVADSAQTLGVKWASDTTNTVADAAGDMLIGTADNVIAKLATTGLTGATSYTPTLTQSGTVTKTVDYAKYIQIGKLTVCWWRLTVTGTGSAGNGIVIGTPVTAATSRGAFGAFHFLDTSGSLRFVGIADLASTTTIQGWLSATAGVNSVIGVSGSSNVAIGNTDTLDGFLVFEAA